MCGPHKLKCSECAWYYKQRVIQGGTETVSSASDFRCPRPSATGLWQHRHHTDWEPRPRWQASTSTSTLEDFYWRQRTSCGGTGRSGPMACVAWCGCAARQPPEHCALVAGFLTSWRSQHLVTGIHDGIQWWVYGNYNSQCSNILLWLFLVE
jgi:hypothetical protein